MIFESIQLLVKKPIFDRSHRALFILVRPHGFEPSHLECTIALPLSIFLLAATVAEVFRILLGWSGSNYLLRCESDRALLSFKRMRKESRRSRKRLFRSIAGLCNWLRAVAWGRLTMWELALARSDNEFGGHAWSDCAAVRLCGCAAMAYLR